MVTSTEILALVGRRADLLISGVGDDDFAGQDNYKSEQNGSSLERQALGLFGSALRRELERFANIEGPGRRNYQKTVGHGLHQFRE